MLFRAVTSLAILAASATSASAEPQPKPYRLAVMPLPGQSLMRRDNSVYKPDLTQCNKQGNTCAEACGAGYDQCPGGQSNVAHCFNPAQGQSCCTDNSGNSCEKGYYCTHDNQKRTWCCPDGMDVKACAAARGVDGLEPATAKPAPSTTKAATTTSAIKTTSSSTTTTTTTLSTTTTKTTTSKTSSTTHTSTTPFSSSTTTAALNTTTAINTTTTHKHPIYTASALNTTAWFGHNTSYTSLAPTQPSQGFANATSLTSTFPPLPAGTNAAAASGVSALLLVAAGFIALV